jgi:hypothetical protein
VNLEDDTFEVRTEKKDDSCLYKNLSEFDYPKLKSLGFKDLVFLDYHIPVKRAAFGFKTLYYTILSPDSDYCVTLAKTQ